MVTSEAVSLADLRRLRANIIEGYREAIAGGETKEAAEHLGRLLRIYLEFHRRTNEMMPDRATDFSDTCEAIMEQFTDKQKEACRAAFENDVLLDAQANTVPALPYLSALTLRRMAPSRHAFEAARFKRFPSRR